MILLSSDSRRFPFFLTLELAMSSLAFNGKCDKASTLCRIEALVFSDYPFEKHCFDQLISLNA
jgi:hypothetical protein